MRAPPLVLAHAPDSAKSTVSTSQHSLDDARVPESVVVFGDEWLVGDASMDLCVRPASPSGVPDLSSDRHVDRIVPGFRITDLSGRVLYR